MVVVPNGINMMEAFSIIYWYPLGPMLVKVKNANANPGSDHCAIAKPGIHFRTYALANAKLYLSIQEFLQKSWRRKRK